MIKLEPVQVIEFSEKVDKLALRVEALKKFRNRGVKTHLTDRAIKAMMHTTLLISPSSKLIKELGLPETFFDFNVGQLRKFMVKMKGVDTFLKSEMYSLNRTV